MTRLQPYSEYAPTGFDRRGAFLIDRQNWLVGPVGRNRDSEALQESNFEAFEAILNEAGCFEREEYEIHRFGHWAPGWFEIFLLRPETKAAELGEEIAEKLEDYFVIDEDDLSEREWEETCELWQHHRRAEFAKTLALAITPSPWQDDYWPLIDEFGDEYKEGALHEIYGRYGQYESPHEWDDRAYERVTEADILDALKWPYSIRVALVFLARYHGLDETLYRVATFPGEAYEKIIMSTALAPWRQWRRKRRIAKLNKKYRTKTKEIPQC